MGVLTYAEISDIVKDAVVSNTATDAPIATAELLRAINVAYTTVWEISGGGIKSVASATAWTSAQLATGVVAGILTDIRKVLHVFASATAGSVGVSAGDTRVEIADFNRIQFLRKSNLTGTYDRPKVCSLTRLETAVAADVGKLQLDYFPGVTGFYLPITYVPQFTPMDGDPTDKPNVNDLESYDIAWIAAADLAPRLGRADLLESIMLKISDGTRMALERRMKTMLAADRG